MDPADDRAAAYGKAARTRVSNTRAAGGGTPGGMLGFLRSPFSAAVKTVKHVLASPREAPPPSTQDNSNAASDQQRTPEPKANPTAQQDTRAQAAIQGVVAAAIGTSSHKKTEPVAPSTSTQPMEQDPKASAPTAAALLGGLESTVLNQETAGWSPSKLNSLNFFLTKTAPAPSLQVAAPAPAPQPGPEPDNQRPYLGLKYLLRMGPSGVGAPSSLFSHGQPGAAASAPSQPRPQPIRQPLAASTNRFAPYPLQPPSKLNFAGPKPTVSALPPPSPFGGSAAPSLQGTPLPSLRAPAAPQLPPSSFKADMSMRLALANTRPEQAAGAATPRVMGTPFPSRPAGTPLLQSAQPSGAMGLKRGRESPVGTTPLVGSGIKNLAEYKRQRQRYTTQAKSIMPGLTGARTPREGTASLSASEEPTPSQPGPVVAATETARKILDTLNNMAQAGDSQPASTSSTPFAKSHTKLGAPGATPFPRGQPPPLDRLTPASNAGTPEMRAKTTPGSSSMLYTPQATPAAKPMVLFPALMGSSDEPASPLVIAAAPATAAKTATPTPGEQLFAFGGAGKPAAPAAPEGSMVLLPAAAAAPAPAQAATPASDGQLQESSAPAKVFEFGGSNKKDQLSKLAADVTKAVQAADGIPLPTFSFGSKAGGPKVVMPEARAPPVPAAPVAMSVKEQVAQAAAIPLPDDDEPENPSPAPSSKAPSPAATPAASAPAPASGGWDLAFLAKSQAHMTKVADAVSEEVAKAKGGDAQKSSSAVTFAFGAPAAAKAAEAPAPAAAPAEEAAPSPAPVSNGWGDILAKSQAAMAKASEAVAQEIEKAQAGKGGAAAATPTVAFGSPLPAGKLGGIAAAADGAAPAAAPSSGFVFGAPAAAPQQTEVAAPATVFSFGAASTTPAAATPTEPAAAAAQAPAGQSSTPASFAFGAAAAAAAAAPKHPPITFNLAPTPAPAASPEPAAAAPPAFAFGQQQQQAPAPATSAAPAFSFGAATATPAASSAPAASPAPFAFGAGSSTPAAAPAPSPPAAFAFGGSSAAPATAGFGAAPAASTPAAGFVFGASAPATTTPAQAPAAASPFNAPSNPFGSSSAAPSFGASTPSAAPAFGVAPSQPPASGGFVFGAQPTAQPSPSPFGAPPATMPFGGQPSPAPGFGSAPAPNPFQASPAPANPFGAPQAAAASPFGAQPAPQPSFGGFGGAGFGGGFGAAPAAAAPAFGAAQPAPAFGGGAGFGGFGAAAPAPDAGGAFGAGAGGDAGGGGFTIGAAGEGAGTRRRIRAKRHGG